MKTMVPKEKMSKKNRRKLDQQRRVSWGFSPANRVKESKKAYRRIRIRPQDQGAFFTVRGGCAP